MSRRWINSVDVEVSGGGALAVLGLVPTAEADLTPIILADDDDHTVPLAAGAVILLLQGDGAFVEGQAPPDPDDNIPRAAGTVWSIPCRGRSQWHLARVGDGTVTIRGKVLLEA